MKQKLGTRPYGHYVWGAPTKNAGVSNWSGSPCWFFPPVPRVSLSLFGPPVVEEPQRQPLGASTHDPQIGPLHRKPPACQPAQGSKVARAKKNLACQNLHPRLPRFPRLGLSDLTTRLSTHGGDRYHVNCVRTSSCVSITATSEIPLSLSLLPLTLAQKWIPTNPGKF